MKKTKILNTLLGAGKEMKEMLVFKGKYSVKAHGRIQKALAKDFGNEIAHDIGFNFCDWLYDAATILALNLCPEKFTLKEINSLCYDFLSDGSSHIITAQLLQYKGMGLNKEQAYKMIAIQMDEVFQ